MLIWQIIFCCMQVLNWKFVQSIYILSAYNSFQFIKHMEKRSTKTSEKDKPTWDWMQVQCTLKINESNKRSVVWNLTPTIILTNPTSEYSDPNVRLYIDTQKSLQYSPQLGWNWHKSWNLPNISIRLEIKDENNGQPLLAPKNLYAQMFAVKRNSENQRTEHLSLIDVGIRGQSKMEMIDGQVYFSAMKFSSTTYNNEGMNFNLLIVLYINEDGNQKPKILTAVMSAGIFVDSRRSARDYQEKKFNSFIEPFLYENLEKQYIKRQNKSKTQCQVIIKNDPQGFYNYLTAPNIRHKVKHPVFLAIKFSNCVQILYSTQQLQNMNPKLLIENLQKKLLKQNKSKLKNEAGFLGSPNDKTFIFLVQNMSDSLKKKKVMQSIETMENSAIGIVYDRKQLNNTFQSIGEPDALIKAYRQSYENLLEQCKKYEPSDSQDYSSEEQEEIPSQRSNKKVKLDDNQKALTGSANGPVKKPTKNNGYEKSYLKKQQEEQHIQQPKFFPPTLNDFGSKKGSAFNRAVGSKTIAQQNDENQDNRNIENMQYQMSKQTPQRSPIRLAQQQQPMQQDPSMNISPQGQTKNLENLICDNLMLSYWLNNVKNNNVNLYDNMTGNNIGQQLLNQPTMDRFNNGNDRRNGQNPYQVNEQLQCLMQQINLYRQLLAQVTYQNALLGGRNYPPNGTNQQTPQPQPSLMNYPPQMLHNMLAPMSGLGGLGGSGLNQMGNLGGLGGLGGMNLAVLGGNPNINGQGMSHQNMGGQGFPPQGMGGSNNLGGMMPNLQNLQTLQALQSLGGLMNPGGLGGLQSNFQMPNNNMNSLNQFLRNQHEQQAKQQEKRERDQGK